MLRPILFSLLDQVQRQTQGIERLVKFGSAWAYVVVNFVDLVWFGGQI